MITRRYPFSHDVNTSDVERVVRKRRISSSRVNLKRFMLRPEWLVFKSFDWCSPKRGQTPHTAAGAKMQAGRDSGACTSRYK